MDNDSNSGVVKKATKSRSPNFTRNEKNLLLNLVLVYKKIIECKKSDAVTWREKERCWKSITVLFNKRSTAGVYRKQQSLKNCYENTKKNVRLVVSDEKVSTKRTGGGKGKMLVNDPTFDLALAAMNPKTVHGLAQDFDSDSQTLIKQEASEDLATPGISINNLQPFFPLPGHDSDSDDSKPVDEGETHQDVEHVADNNNMKWGDFKVGNLKKPINRKLVPLSTAGQATPPQNSVTLPDENRAKPTETLSWTARPAGSNLSSSDLAKKYDQLAELKIKLTTYQLEALKNEHTVTEERKEELFALKKKSLELDIDIKRALLQKIDDSSASDLLLCLLQGKGNSIQ